MVRVKRSRISQARHKKILKLARGFRSAHSTLFRTANSQVTKSYIYTYVSRRQCKRFFKKLFVLRINAWIQSYSRNASYSRLKSLIRLSTIKLNLQMMAHMAILDPIGLLFTAVTNFGINSKPFGTLDHIVRTTDVHIKME